MKVLICGSEGYVGSVLTEFLSRSAPEIDVFGFDTGFFRDKIVFQNGARPKLAVASAKDIRRLEKEDLEGFDAVINLAAISNDPMGAEFEAATHQINLDASTTLAEMAKEAGVKRFVFASSCSVYGCASSTPRREGDELDPLTTYAKLKVEHERALEELADNEFIVSAFRFATACGPSPRLRLDLVLNDFVYSAVRTGKIVVLSNGEPWRPLIDVRDMAGALTWGLFRDADLGSYLCLNTGSNENNVRVRDLAELVASILPNAEVSINLQAPADKRSYQVNFDRYAELNRQYPIQYKLEDSIKGLRDQVAWMASNSSDATEFVRLRTLKEHILAGRLDQNLYWC